MDAVRLGPLVIPIQVALTLAGIFTANAVAAWFQRYRGADPGPILWKMTVAGLLAARLVFIMRHHALYLGDPLSMIDVRDGGFDGLAGFLAAFVVGAELTRRGAALRRPLLVAALAGCAMFFGAAALNRALAPVQAPLPAADLVRLDGTPAPLASFAGRPLVINLWATWCPPCRREMPVLAAAQKAHPDVVFLFVNQGETAQIVQRYLGAQELAMHNVLLDPAMQVSGRTGASGYPTTLFYDARGLLVHRHMGEFSRATLEDSITARLR